MSKVEKEAKRAGRSFDKNVLQAGRDFTEDFFTGKVFREKIPQEIGNTVGTLTGTRQLKLQMRAQAKQQRKLIAEQEVADEEAEVRRRAMLRATLSERPNLFSILGSQQGTL